LGLLYRSTAWLARAIVLVDGDVGEPTHKPAGARLSCRSSPRASSGLGATVPGSATTIPGPGAMPGWYLVRLGAGLAWTLVCSSATYVAEPTAALPGVYENTAGEAVTAAPGAPRDGKTEPWDTWNCCPCGPAEARGEK
jgi:hypothetical protein